jgi:endoglucanase
VIVRSRRTAALAVALALAAPVLAAAPAAGQAAAAPACERWPEWARFKENFLDPGGRVIDPGSPARHSTSEGQSYGLFFALVANDRDSFERILRWTEDNLAGGDLTARLPAWQWGKRADGSWGVMDENAAADADLWIAYVLTEAGRLWNSGRHTALGRVLAARILREEVADLPGLGPTLLPGPNGFRPGGTAARLNPSYVPIQLLRRMADLYPQQPWTKLVSSAMDMTVRSAPRGFVPDWVLYKSARFEPDTDSGALGNWNAIRSYLWAGTLADGEPLKAVLLRSFAPMTQHLVATGTPPLDIDTRTGRIEGVGPAGFSAALLPLLAGARQDAALRLQRDRIEARSPFEGKDNYYDQALTLFGLGWANGRYRYDRAGMLVLRWPCGRK